MPGSWKAPSTWLPVIVNYKCIDAHTPISISALFTRYGLDMGET